MEEKKEKKPSIWNRILKPDAEIVKYGKWCAIAPLIIIAVGMLVVLVFNFNLGLDFTGGTIVKISNFEKDINDDAIYKDYENEISKMLNDEFGVSKISFQRAQDSTTQAYTMTVTYNNSSVTDEQIKEINVKIKDVTGATVEDSESISASAGSEKLMNAFIAVSVALIGILIYIAFRFRFTSGVAGIIGLLHDVLVMMALVAIFRIQINFVFIAVLITIVGYSINNTLVLFDRVREYEKDTSIRKTTVQIVDQSIKDTFGRTLNTTITTIVPVLILAIIGVPLIREFAVPILFGLVAGAYSTIFLTSSLYVRFENAKAAKKRLEKK